MLAIESSERGQFFPLSEIGPFGYIKKHLHND